MLLDHNPWTFALIVGTKFFFTYIGLACVVYFFVVAFVYGVPGISHPFSIIVEVYGLIEALWYLAWFLPFKARLQRPGIPMRPLKRADRRRLVALLLQNVPDMRLFIRKWFNQAHLDQIYRDNVKDWLAWALFARDRKDLRREEWEEIDEYVDDAQQLARMELPLGRAEAKPIRLNLDPVEMYHRPLLWYGLIFFTDVAGWIFLAIKGFKFYRQPRNTFFSIFPFRPMTLLSPNVSASPVLSYYYRPHTSKTHRPMLFIHGIGIGIPTYMTWLPNIPEEIGIVAVEIMNVSNRICPEGMPPDVFADAVAKILRQQKMNDVVMVSHSYGTFLARPLLDHPEVGPKINSMVLCDPVAILVHLPNVAYNITRRKGKITPEIEIDFGAGRDPMIAHTVCRRVHWPEHILFREDMAGRRTTAVVAGRDCVLDGPSVASYMYYGRVQHTDAEIAELKGTWNSWTGRGAIELMYLPDRDHGQSLLLPNLARRISKAIATYADRSKDPATASVEPKTEVGPPPSPPDWNRDVGTGDEGAIPMENASPPAHPGTAGADSNGKTYGVAMGDPKEEEWRETKFVDSYASSRYSVPYGVPPLNPREVM